MKSYEPLITVYIVNHNYERYLLQSINSVLDQTLQDFELIIIDNGSTDGSQNLIEKFSPHEKVLTIFQENLGLNTANNIALGRANGRYLIRVDADDFLDHHALQVLSSTLDRHPDIGLVFPDFYLTDATGQVLKTVRRQDISKASLLDLPPHGACTMVRRECLHALEGYDETYNCQDGWDLWLRFIENYGVQNVNLPLFYYRQHGANLTGDKSHLFSTRADILSKKVTRDTKPLNCIAVIPVRGSQIEPVSYALRPLGGKALIDWTLEAAISAKRVSRVLVTSPDEKILEHVTKQFAQDVAVVRRDWKLATLSSPLDASLTDLFEHLNNDWRTFDAVSVLYIESPFRSARYIDMAVDVLEVFKLNQVIGMYREDSLFYHHNGHGMTPVHSSESVQNELEDLYRRSGGLFVIRRGHWFRDIAHAPIVGHVELDEAAALKVHSKWSWKIAEMHAQEIVSRNGSVD